MTAVGFLNIAAVLLILIATLAHWRMAGLARLPGQHPSARTRRHQRP
jgi:hypothetical protein